MASCYSREGSDARDRLRCVLLGARSAKSFKLLRPSGERDVRTPGGQTPLALNPSSAQRTRNLNSALGCRIMIHKVFVYG
jgi:hypothetical protein